MTFHFTDADGHHLEVEPDTSWDGQPAVTLRACGEYRMRVPVRIPIDRLEELVAGLRDTARQSNALERTSP